MENWEGVEGNPNEHRTTGTRYRIDCKSLYDPLNIQSWILRGVLVPDDTLQQIADAWNDLTLELQLAIGEAAPTLVEVIHDGLVNDE